MSIGLQNESILDEQGMKDIFNCIGVFPLVLHTLKFFPIIAKEKAKFNFKAPSFISLLLLIFFITIL
jgi:hypothetical protein